MSEIRNGSVAAESAARDESEDVELEPLMSPAEVGEWLSISRRTVYDLESDGEIEGVQVGGQVRFERSEIRDFIRRNRREGDRP